MKKISSSILLVLVLLACSACNLPQHGAQTLPEQPGVSPTLLPILRGTAFPPAAATFTPTVPGSRPATPPGALPPPAGDPNGAVQAYLVAYPDDTAGMLSCLSRSLRAALPAGGPGELLQVQGDVNGFVIQSGSQVPNAPQAVILVALQAGGARSLRTFNLIQENNKWVINSITP